MSRNDSCKMAFIGQSGVGKSSIVHRIVRNKFVETIDTTIGAAFSSAIYKGVRYQIWDTAGQERFEALIPMYIRNASVIIVVYDVHDINSIYKVKQQWFPFIENNGENHHVILIGNKCDLLNDYNNDVIEQAKQISQEYNVPHIIASAKNNINITDILDKIDECILNNTPSFFNKQTNQTQDTQETVTLDDETWTSNRMSSCIGCNVM